MRTLFRTLGISGLLIMYIGIGVAFLEPHFWFVLFVLPALAYLVTEAVRKERTKKANCLIKKGHFLFPKGYYFKYGFLKDRKDLPFEAISEIRSFTTPLCAVVNDKEIIFLRGLTIEDLKKSGRLGKIKFRNRIDPWNPICREFSSTQVEETLIEGANKLLNEHGFAKEEILRLRQEIRFKMSVRAFFMKEDEYLNHYDVLRELWPLNSKRYWWTMEIAMRIKRSEK